MFRTLIYPSSGACDCVVELPHRSSCSQFVVCLRFSAADFVWCSFCRLEPAKPSVPCRRFPACKFMWKSEFRQNYRRQLSRPQLHFSLLGSLALLRTYRHLAKVGTSKGGGKQWQTTPKNLPRMQCARAIPVTLLGSGSCQPGL